MVNFGPQINLDSLTDEEFNVRFEAFLADTITSEEARKTCRTLPMAKKREMLANDLKAKESHQQPHGKGGKFANFSPTDYIKYLYKEETKKNRDNVYYCLESLQVELKCKGVSWVKEFGKNSGINAIITILQNIYRDSEAKNKSNYRATTHSILVKCLQAFMNNTYGLQQVFDHENALVVLAKSINVNYPYVMTDAVKLMAVLCLVPNGHEKVLEAITTCAELEGRARFLQIIAGSKKSENEPMVVACFQLINAIISSVDDLDFKLHLRNEIVRGGFGEVLQRFENSRAIISTPLDLQMKIFNEAKDDDLEEFRDQRFSMRFDFGDIDECFQLLKSFLAKTPAEQHFLSILQHLLCIRDDAYARPAYYRLIEECISQIVLHKNGLDPDFCYTKRFNIDVDYVIDQIVERYRSEAPPPPPPPAPPLDP